MTLTDISTLINTVFSLNEEGATPVDENLSNFGDTGITVAVSNMVGDELLNYSKKFAVGVAKNYFDNREFKADTFGIYKDSVEFAGAIQRIKMEMLDADTMHSVSLTNNTQYTRDNTYNGVDGSAKIYTKDNSYCVWYSIPSLQFKTYFSSAEGVIQYVNLIERRVADTITFNLRLLAKRVINKAISTTSNIVNLVSIYNDETGETETEPTKLLQNGSFLRWANSRISEIVKSFTSYGKVFNNAEINTFSAENDIECLMLDRYADSVKNNVRADVFNSNELSKIDYRTIDFWESRGADISADFDDISSVTKTVGVGETPSTYVENIIAIGFDKNGIGITNKILDTRTSYNGDGGFTNTYMDVLANYYNDLRENFVVFTMN